MSRSANNRDDSKEWTQRVALACRVMIFISFGCAITLGILSYFFTTTVFGNEYSKASVLIPTLLVAAVWLIPFKTLNADLAGEGKPKYSIYVMVPATIINIFSNWILIPPHGALGSAYASIISYFITGILITIIYSMKKNIAMRELLVIKYHDITIIYKNLKKLKKI